MLGFGAIGEFALSEDSGVTDVVANGAVTLAFGVSATADHGVAGAGAVALEFGVSSSAGHGVAGAGAVALEFGVSATAVHDRYELKGEVRESGVLVNRRVRAHRRSSGELVAEGDTVVGAFKLQVGFAQDEFYVVPIDLGAAAADWAPPVANRVLSVLAQDA